jgi:hypothetical protein
MYRISVPVFQQSLSALASSLEKAETYGTDRRMESPNILRTRLYPNMYSLSQQVEAAVRQALWACSLLADEERREPSPVADQFDSAQSSISTALEILGRYQPAQIDGSEDRTIQLALPSRTMEFTGERFLLGFALPNFFFHVSVAHAILRHCGVDLNKGDFLGAF